MSFLTSTALSSFEIYQTFKREFSERLQDLFDSDEPDLLYKAFVDTPQVGNELKRVLSNLIPQDHKDKIGLSLYSHKPDDSEWRNLFSQGFPHAQESIPTGLKNQLQSAIGKKHIYNPDIFIGMEGRKELFFDLTSENDNMNYILHVSLEREGLLKFLESEKKTFISFTTIVLTLSLILGAFFAKSLSRPIQKLAEQALLFSKGNMEVRFKSKRLDDIGILARSLDKMSLNLKHRFDSMQTMNRIDKAVLSSLSRRDLLNKVANYISEQFDSNPVAVFVHRKDGAVLSALVPDRNITLGRIISFQTLPEHFLNISNDIREMSKNDLEIHKDILLPDLIQEETIAIPILNNEERMATLIISQNQFSDQDREALGMLADQVGVALRSMNEVEQREDMSKGILMALTRSVDAKSRWTAGHSERVSSLSIALGKKLNMNTEEIQSIRIAALLHDIGKLGIPESILDKPGRLSEEEFTIIKSHPQKGDIIIQDLPGFEEVRMGVRHHHEKWDGSGYPDGLSGKRIPLIARILTLADVYDAISEDRPYRKGFTPEESYTFLQDQSGSIFDPDLLPLFLSLISEEALS
jgi:HD-GYP domain-containing protein (c-di-GMP phosphodiesterase class II)